MNAADHFVKVTASSRSLFLFEAYEGAIVEKAHQGDRRTAAPRFSDSSSLGMSGCGCVRWESTPKAKLPPAESPQRMICGGVSNLGRITSS